MINCYLGNIREMMCAFLSPSCFLAPLSRPWVTFKTPFRDLQRRWNFKQLWLWQGASQFSRECLTTSQLLLRDTSADNHPWIFIRRRCWRAHAPAQMTIIHNNASLIKESSLSGCRAAELCWNNQSVKAFRVGFSFCLSQHAISFGGQHFNQRRVLISVLSPNVDSRVCSKRAFWLH